MTTVDSVAFFRALDLGHRRCPTRPQLLGAFAEAGAPGAVNFQTNGTVLFSAAEPAVVARHALGLLAPICGYEGSVLVRTADWVLGLGLEDLGRGAEVSLFDLAGPFPRPVPWRPTEGRLTVVRADDRHAVSVNDDPATGSATAIMERHLGVPVTSRGVPTMHRLAARIVASR